MVKFPPALFQFVLHDQNKFVQFNPPSVFIDKALFQIIELCNGLARGQGQFL